MRDSNQLTTFLAFVCLAVCLGGMVAILIWFDKLYYEPLCRRYGEAHQLTYEYFRPRYRRSRSPAKCVYLVPDTGTESGRQEVLVKHIPKTLRDYVVQVSSWICAPVLAGATVWLVWQVGGFKKD